jgi:hypothetical protein
MTDTAPHRSRHARTAAEKAANRSLGGLLVYIALLPVAVGLLAAPTLVGAFALGVVTAAVVSELSSRVVSAAYSTLTVLSSPSR